VVLVLLDQDLRVHDFCLVIPSQQMPELGYSETITVDPLTKRFEPYRVASDQVGTVLLSQLFRKRVGGAKKGADDARERLLAR